MPVKQCKSAGQGTATVLMKSMENPHPEHQNKESLQAGGPETQTANQVPKQTSQFWRVPKEPNPSFAEDMRGKWKSLKTRFMRYDKELLSVSEDWTLSERWVRTVRSETFVHTQEHEVWAYKNLLAAASLTEEAEWVYSVSVIMFSQAWGVFLRPGIKRKLSLFSTFKKCRLMIYSFQISTFNTIRVTRL